MIFFIFIYMRYIISEKQLANLIVKQSISDDLEYDSVDDANPENDDFVIGQEVGEQDASSGAADNPSYPEVPKWGEHDTQTPTRGPANTTF